jgi:hypothetical protein
MFPDRRITVKSRVAEGDTVVEETEWIGTASDQHPTLQEGERQRLRAPRSAREARAPDPEARRHLVGSQGARLATLPAARGLEVSYVEVSQRSDRVEGGSQTTEEFMR